MPKKLLNSACKKKQMSANKYCPRVTHPHPPPPGVFTIPLCQLGKCKSPTIHDKLWVLTGSSFQGLSFSDNHLIYPNFYYKTRLQDLLPVPVINSKIII